MVNLLKWLFGYVGTKGFTCSFCGREVLVLVRARKGEAGAVECDCGKLWCFEWCGDHWKTKCWVPLTENQVPPTVNVQTADAAADFKRRRESGEFGPRNEAELQEVLANAARMDRETDEGFGPHDLG